MSVAFRALASVCSRDSGLRRDDAHAAAAGGYEDDLGQPANDADLDGNDGAAVE